MLPDESRLTNQPGSLAGFTAFFEAIPEMVTSRIDLPSRIGHDHAILIPDSLLFVFKRPNNGEPR